MDGSLIIEAYKPMMEAYKRIEAACKMLGRDDVLTPELRRLLKKNLAEAEQQFMACLDQQVDSRLSELMDLARRELAQSEKQERKQKRQRMPQLVAVK